MNTTITGFGGQIRRGDVLHIGNVPGAEYPYAVVKQVDACTLTVRKAWLIEQWIARARCAICKAWAWIWGAA